MKDQEIPKETGFVLIGAFILGALLLVVRRLRYAPRKRPYKAPEGLPEGPTAEARIGAGDPAPAAGGLPDGGGAMNITTAPDSPIPSVDAASQEAIRERADQAAAPVPVTSTRWTSTTRYMATAGIVIFVIWLIAFSQQTLSLLVFAALIALLAQPVIHFFQNRLRVSSGLAVMITYILIAIILVMIPILVLPNIINGVNTLLDFNWQGLLNQVSDTLHQSAVEVSAFPAVGQSLASTLESLSISVENLLIQTPGPVEGEVNVTNVLDELGKAIGVLDAVLGPLISGVLSLIFMFLISIQMSLVGGEVRGWIVNPIPSRFKEEVSALLDRIELVWVSFLHGQFALMVVMGFLVWLMNVLLGTPQAILLGIMAGLLEVIPSLGPTLAAVPAAVLALVFGSSHFPELAPWIFMLIVIAGYVLLNLVENQVLVPRILGSAVSLPPLIVLIGVTIAGAKAGIVGIFLATPVIATGRELLEFVYNKIIEAPEQESPAPPKASFWGRVRSVVGRLRLPRRQKDQVEGKSPTGAASG
jgi:predicted PurR-regulated permease PerM